MSSILNKFMRIVLLLKIMSRLRVISTLPRDKLEHMLFNSSK